ncbi:hypothetical protein [Rudaeicoccus suwonensis]|uniref:Peptidase inhibitor family I36 n=1 Tax=Rudaeicoccus suwonensis TaxID=657409 RepID=A0A561EB25_9MICO|nr:hypothetical protein [Rudaeicoccus suwonensis]TWE12810.1 hypothetical protein BKA23_1629 [Rudaeicoccus suwonensis]
MDTTRSSAGTLVAAAATLFVFSSCASTGTNEPPIFAYYCGYKDVAANLAEPLPLQSAHSSNDILPGPNLYYTSTGCSTGNRLSADPPSSAKIVNLAYAANGIPSLVQINVIADGYLIIGDREIPIKPDLK